MTTPAKKPVLGVGVSCTSYGEVLRLCREWIEKKSAARYVCIVSVHGIITAFMDKSFRPILNGADIGTTDGMPLVWAMRWLGASNQRRVYGPNLMLAMCGQATRLGHRIFLYGGREETLSVLGDRLRRRFPGIQIVGAYSPPFRRLTPEEDAACTERINASQADLVFVGIGCPKQERWMAEHQPKLPGVVMLGVGAAFDFHCGYVRQAPRWMQQAGLEWLFRLLVEPARLWRRYAVIVPLFAILWSLQMSGILRYRTNDD